MDEAEAGLAALAERLGEKRRGRKPTDKGVMLQVGDLLTKKGVQAFFDVTYTDGKLSYERVPETIAKESLRDGKFLIRTNTKLPAGDVVTSYKTLMGIERAFRQIKNFLDVGPMYHWNEKRVRGYIFICVLAYLFEQEMQVLYRKACEETAADDWRTGESLIRELRSWKVVKAALFKREFMSVPKPTTTTKTILANLGITLPPQTIRMERTSGPPAP